MPDRFPVEATLRNGARVILRPFTERDTEPLYEFFQRLPPNVRRLAWDHIDDHALVESWGQNIDYAKVFPLLALDGRRIVADASLHRRKWGPLRLVGRVKWLMDPAYRGQGLGSLLVNQLISIAHDHGLRHVSCMLLSELEGDAIRVLRELGFVEQHLPGYGVDPDGNPYDMVKLVLKL